MYINLNVNLFSQNVLYPLITYVTIFGGWKMLIGIIRKRILKCQKYFDFWHLFDMWTKKKQVLRNGWRIWQLNGMLIAIFQSPPIMHFNALMLFKFANNAFYSTKNYAIVSSKQWLNDWCIITTNLRTSTLTIKRIEGYNFWKE